MLFSKILLVSLYLPPAAYASNPLYLSGAAQQPLFSLGGDAQDRPGGLLLGWSHDQNRLAKEG